MAKRSSGRESTYYKVGHLVLARAREVYLKREAADYDFRSMADTFLENGNGLDFVEVIQRRQLGVFAEEHPSLDKVRQKDFGLVAHVLAGRDSKDVVQFLQTRKSTSAMSSLLRGLNRLSPRSYLECALLSFYFGCGVSHCNCDKKHSMIYLALRRIS